jgi:hypothetical protein
MVIYRQFHHLALAGILQLVIYPVDRPSLGGFAHILGGLAPNQSLKVVEGGSLFE